MSDEPSDAGWFDLLSEVYVHPRMHPASRGTAATAAHEGAHRNLAITTSVGTALRYLQALSTLASSKGRSDSLQRLTDQLFAGTFLVQEGWASYVEHLYHEHRGTPPGQVAPLPSAYTEALDHYLRAGRRLPESTRGAEPLLLQALAAAAMNTRILARAPSQDWLDVVSEDLGNPRNVPDYRVRRICEAIEIHGWPDAFLQASMTLIKSRLGIAGNLTRGEIHSAMGSTQQGEALNALQQEIDEAFASNMGMVSAELVDHTQTDVKSCVLEWWDAAQQHLVSLGVKVPGLQDGYDWLSHLADSNVTYVEERLIEDALVDESTFVALWTNIPDTVHAHMHIGEGFASILFYDVPADVTSSESPSQFLRQRAILPSLDEALGALTSGLVERRSLSSSSALASNATFVATLEGLASPLDWVLVEESFDPQITFSLLQHYVDKAERILLGATQNPDIGWLFGDMGPIPDTTARFMMCCRAFPGFFNALELHEPALLERLWAKSSKLQQASREHEVAVKIVELYAIGGALPPYRPGEP
ncbi:hypothetical protein [Modestobacter sp. I12A-02662]|uniref:hypothetical protein n=1 Tax=Modestobacter sp. I12A-02662 TaxID=1730496 RepID=UPI0034DE799A